MLECMTYMLPELTYEESSSFQSIFQAETERNIGFNKIKKQTSHILQHNHPTKNICPNTLFPSFVILAESCHSKNNYKVLVWPETRYNYNQYSKKPE